MAERLCIDCANPLFVTEHVRCFPCFQSDVLWFLEALRLGAINAVRRVTITLRR